MATKTLSRRQWIKNSSLVTGSFALLSGSLTDVFAAPTLGKYVCKECLKKVTTQMCHMHQTPVLLGYTSL